MQVLRSPAAAWPAASGTRASPIGGRRGPRPLLPAARPAPSRPASARPRRLVGRAAASSTAYGELTIGIPKETAAGERRVAATPATVEQLLKAGFRRVLVERGAGEGAGLPDSAFAAAGATLVAPAGGGDGGGHAAAAAAALSDADVVLRVRPPTLDEARALRPGATLVSHIAPARNGALLAALRERGATVVAMDCVPRQLPRAQAFDALSSMANIAGYRAVIEAAHRLGRFFAGQITAAGRVPPAKVLVIGGGVAGLAAAGAARSLGAIVRVFDTREAVREQAKSQGAEFLTVVGVEEESGEGQGGYGKEMSRAFLDAEMALFSAQCREVDVIVTTALVPGKPAPVLLTEAMVDSMRPGSVIVDLAAEAGGNCAYTVAGEVVVAPLNGVSVVGFTDLPSRLPGTASALYASNISKFLLSMGPFSTGEGGRLAIDHGDEAVRGALVIEKGELRWPAPPPKSVERAQARAAAEAAAAAAQAAENVARDGAMPAASAEDALRAATLKSALATAGAAAATLALGAASPGPAFSSMLTKFGLASASGYMAVRGVPPALHSPLMSVTNAISGLTAVGGMALAGGGLVPQTAPQWLAATAVAASAVNIGGGFTVTERMLSMFRRPGDPREHTGLLFAIPGAALLGGFAAGEALGLEGVAGSAYLVSSACCIAAIACLSTQSSARAGNALGMLGVAGGVAATLGTLLAASAASSADGSPDYATAAQLVALLGAGGAAGAAVASRIAITELPQSVAATHALVGLAATLTAVATVSSSAAAEGGGAGGGAADGLAATTAFLSCWIGAVTLTGSAVAFGKLQGILAPAPLSLPGKNAINLMLAAASVALGAFFIGGGYDGGGMGGASFSLSAAGVLGATAFVAGGLGAHLVASIGGADMPVVITLLNSYSGYALCAEGFLLNNDLLTTVGALIGSSGALLSYIMCRAMNRSLPNVIFGGYGNAAPPEAAAAGGGTGGAAPAAARGPVATMGAAEVAEALATARRVLIVPGYGMAVAGAQHSCSELAKLLAARGVEVEFGVHPVAGRMPGQLNVLLAEAGVDFEIVKEMDEVNPRMEQYDVALVIGANDVVNSASKEDPASVLYGMPSIEVWRSKQMIFSKRSLAAGYAGADNLCFYKPNGALFLGDAKASLDALRAEIEGKQQL